MGGDGWGGFGDIPLAMSSWVLTRSYLVTLYVRC